MVKTPHNPPEDKLPKFDSFDEQFAQSLYSQSPPDGLLNKILSIPSSKKEAEKNTQTPPTPTSPKKPSRPYDPWSFSFLKVAAVLVFIFAIASLMDPQNVEAESTLENFAHAYLVKGPQDLEEKSTEKDTLDKWLEADKIQELYPHLSAMGFTMNEQKIFRMGQRPVCVLHFSRPQKASLWLFLTPSAQEESRLLINKAQLSLIQLERRELSLLASGPVKN